MKNLEAIVFDMLKDNVDPIDPAQPRMEFLKELAKDIVNEIEYEQQAQWEAKKDREGG